MLEKDCPVPSYLVDVACCIDAEPLSPPFSQPTTQIRTGGMYYVQPSGWAAWNRIAGLALAAPKRTRARIDVLN